MQQLIVLMGLPASGKSTWAKQWAADDSEKRIRVCRDDLRRMFGNYLVFSRENFVTIIEQDIVYEALMAGYNVCVDATNINKKYFKWNQLLNDWSRSITFPEVELVINDSFLSVPIEECIRRDSLRCHESVGEQVIRNMWDKLNAGI